MFLWRSCCNRHNLVAIRALSLRRRGICFSYALRKTQKIFFNGCRAPRSLKAKATSLRWIVNFPVPVSPEYRHFFILKKQQLIGFQEWGRQSVSDSLHQTQFCCNSRQNFAGFGTTLFSCDEKRSGVSHSVLRHGRAVKSISEFSFECEF